MKIGFTGTQRGMTEGQKGQVHELLNLASVHEFHHGDCIGADEEAHRIAKDLGIWTVAHPPADPKKRAYTDADEIRESKPYLKRNRDIVDETERLMATPRTRVEQRRSSGTWATVRYARKQEKIGWIIYP